MAELVIGNSSLQLEYFTRFPEIWSVNYQFPPLQYLLSHFCGSARRSLVLSDVDVFPSALSIALNPVSMPFSIVVAIFGALDKTASVPCWSPVSVVTCAILLENRGQTGKPGTDGTFPLVHSHANVRCDASTADFSGRPSF